MLNLYKSILKKPFVPTCFIAAGFLFVAAAVFFEALSYPFPSTGNNTNELTLREPNPPVIDYIKYEDFRAALSVTQDGSDAAVPEPPAVLPGDLYAETAASAADTVTSHTDTDASHAESSQAVSQTQLFVLLGTLKIPKLGVSENTFEGTDSQLNYGVGHVEGTAMPGQTGNCVIAGHRVSTFGNMPFRYLNKLENGDTVSVSFDGGSFIYEVFDTMIVSMYDISVLEPVQNESSVLSLLTCDPVVSAGTRVNRLVVRARLISSR